MYGQKRTPDAMILFGDRAQTIFGRKSVQLYFGYDHLGTIERVYNQQDSVIKIIDYDSFGNILHETLTQLFLPLGFAGGLRDKDTSFIRYCYRDYYPYIGRFTCIEPVNQ